MNTCDFETKNDVVLECKWGFDGSGGHSVYKQKYENQNSSDEFLFVTAFVPLRIRDWATEEILWENDRHSSCRFCRPLKIIYTKETPDVINAVKRSIDAEIQYLRSFGYVKRNFNVHFEMKLTMIDGAVLNVLNNNKSSSCCVLCGAKPSQMNSALVFEREVDEECLKYGLSTLHGWIKCFECIIHIAYKLPIKTWRSAGEEQNDIVKQNKIKIQEKFKREMGLIVDRIKTGFGTSNDGNTARRFFLTQLYLLKSLVLI